MEIYCGNCRVRQTVAHEEARCPGCNKTIMNYDPASNRLVTYSQVDKALREREIIETITSIRASNNDVWMRLLAIALESAPNATKAVLREINQNDRKISDLLGELAK